MGTGAASTMMMTSLLQEIAVPVEVVMLTDLVRARTLPTTPETLGKTNADGMRTTQNTAESMTMMISLPHQCAALVEVDQLALTHSPHLNGPSISIMIRPRSMPMTLELPIKISMRE